MRLLFENKIMVIYENGIVELSNGTVTVSGPRETFDENGLFTVPNSQVLKKSNNSKDYYDNSLVKSLEYFLSCVEKNISLSKHLYEKSVQSNKILFDLVNQKTSFSS